MTSRAPIPSRPAPRQPGFTLLEVMVAVSILAIMIVALLAMFNRTQRSFRAGLTQVDVMESGRATMDLLSRELQQLAPSGQAGVFNIDVQVASTLVQPRIGGANQRNFLEYYFFLNRFNDEWRGTGYVIDTPALGIGTLYRFETNVPVAEVGRLYGFYKDAIGEFPKNFHRVADGIVQLHLRPYDAEGLLSTNFSDKGFVFIGNNLPTYLDMELGILEPKTAEQYRSLTNDLVFARNFLEKQVGKVHLFRQRIPIRTAQ